MRLPAALVFVGAALTAGASATNVVNVVALAAVADKSGVAATNGWTLSGLDSYSEEYEEGIVIAQSRRVGARVRQSVPVMLTVSRGTQWYYLDDCTGQSLDEAFDALRILGVEDIEVLYVQSDAPVGTVVNQSPEPGRQAKDDAVMLTVSGQRILMPSLIGFTLEDAQALIQAEGLEMGTVTEGCAADALPNTVIEQSREPGDELLAGEKVDFVVNQAREVLYYPASKLSVVVPLNGSSVQLVMVAPSGDAQEVYHGVLNTGTYRIALSSAESGQHTVYIYMDSVLMETQTVNFE